MGRDALRRPKGCAAHLVSLLYMLYGMYGCSFNPAQRNARHVLIALATLLTIAGCATTDKKKDETPGAARVTAAEAAASERPDSARAQYELGNAYFDAQRFSEARGAYATATRLDPEMANAFTNLGLTQRVLGDSAAAIESYRRALDILPGDIVTLQNLVVALESENRIAEALGPLARLVELRPGDTGVLRSYAETLVIQERFEDAGHVYAELIRHRPDDLNAHYELGRCYFQLGQWDDAIGAWNTVVAFDRDFGNAHSGLIAAYLEKGDYAGAWKAVRECQRIGAYVDPAVLSRLQDASGKLGPD